MLKRCRWFAAVATLFVATQSISGQSPVTVRVTAPNAPGGTPVVWDPPGPVGALYVSPYTGVLQLSGQTVRLNCVDFFHHVALNSPWQANVTILGHGDMMRTRFNSLELYMQAAWLTQQYTPNPGSNAQRTIAIQAAIWNLFAPNSPDKTDGTGVTSQAYWLSQAKLQSNWMNIQMTKFYVLTAVGAREDNTDNLQQEFLVYDPNLQVVPEPATIVLRGTAVVAMGGVVRRRRSKS